MPPAIIGLALVATGTIAVATLSYIAIGVTVAGMVTGNKKLTKIGGQLGLAAGVAGIATSFMGAGAELAGDALVDAVGANGSGAGVAASGQWGSTVANVVPTLNPADFKYGDTNILEAQKVSDINYSSAHNGANQASDLLNDVSAPTTPAPATHPAAPIGATPGAGVGTNVIDQTNALGMQGHDLYSKYNSIGDGFHTDSPITGSQKATPDGGFFDNFFAKDSNKYLAMETGKIVAGGVQGMATTSNMNAQLTENRRVGDIQRNNAAQVGRSNYGLMRG